MGNTFCFGWEERLILFLQKYMSGAAVKIAGLVTEFGDAILLVAIMGLFYWSLDKTLGRRMIVCLSFVSVVNPFVKSSVRRLRPYMADRNIACLKPVNKEGDIYDVVTQDYSFPSGHAANSVTAYGLIARNRKNAVLRTAAVLLILLVGISRFALGVHYPTDVLAGWLLGGLCVAAETFLEKKLGRYRTFVLLDVVGLAGFFVARTNDFYTGYGLLLGSTLGIIFEEKKVGFAGTDSVPRVLLRTAAGAALFLGLNSLMKLPFSDAFLAGGTLPALTVRALRYAVTAFVLMGVYPMSFGLSGKIKEKRRKRNGTS